MTRSALIIIIITHLSSFAARKQRETGGEMFWGNQGAQSYPYPQAGAGNPWSVPSQQYPGQSQAFYSGGDAPISPSPWDSQPSYPSGGPLYVYPPTLNSPVSRAPSGYFDAPELPAPVSQPQQPPTPRGTLRNLVENGQGRWHVETGAALETASSDPQPLVQLYPPSQERRRAGVGVIGDARGEGHPASLAQMTSSLQEMQIDSSSSPLQTTESVVLEGSERSWNVIRPGGEVPVYPDAGCHVLRREPTSVPEIIDEAFRTLQAQSLLQQGPPPGFEGVSAGGRQGLPGSVAVVEQQQQQQPSF